MRMVVSTTNFSRRNLLSAVPRAPHVTANCTAPCPLLFCFFQILRICGWDIAVGMVTRLRDAKPSEWSRFDFGRSNKFFSSGTSRLPTNTLCSFPCPPPHTCHMPCPSHPPWLDHPSDIWWQAHNTEFLFMQFSAASCYFFPLSPKCLPQDAIDCLHIVTKVMQFPVRMC